MGQSLTTLTTYVYGDDGPPYSYDFAKFTKGRGHRKIDPTDISMFVNCCGTPKEIQIEIDKFDFMYNDLLMSHYNRKHKLKTIKHLLMLIYAVNAEWRTFFCFQRINPRRCPTPQLQEIADLGLNQHEYFLEVLKEYQTPNYRSAYNSLQAVGKFIDDQKSACQKLIQLKIMD